MHVPAYADISFENVAALPESGLQFIHGESPRNAILDTLKQHALVLPDDMAILPQKPHGVPGVALFDFDRDGDLDIYVGNSANFPNGLYSNQLVETGALRFIDVAQSAGVDATDHESSGVCYGDIDNDGDHDLMVLGVMTPHRLYQNQSDGTFVDITQQAGVGGGSLSSAGCAMGDVNNDGLLDLAIANTYTNWNSLIGIVIPYEFTEHNQLFINQGDGHFSDISTASGFETLAGFPPEVSGSASLTWVVSLVDYDSDGDVDAFFADDQGAVLPAAVGGTDYGLLHLMENDGQGNFTDRVVDASLNIPGNWMGTAFADFNCDGHMDFFASNNGDYPLEGQANFPLGLLASRWFLGRPDGGFDDPGVGPLVATPFGWGAGAFDYDNDGDPDIVYHGGINMSVFIETSNPGALLNNDNCTAAFSYDPALAMSTDHSRRIGQGLTTGDLNNDGFIDVVLVSSGNIPEPVPLTQRSANFGSPFDDSLFHVQVFEPSETDPSLYLWNGNENGDGDMVVEISSGDNGNHWVKVELVGMAGILENGRVNRDGIGAVVRFTSDNHKTQTMPIVGGSSYASQHALTAHFGLGKNRQGALDILWPGGIRNQFLGINAGESLRIPEIPCDIASAREHRLEYIGCVKQAVARLTDAGIVDNRMKVRLLRSALAVVTAQ